jgi:DNA-3-methyladenine glycosylase II
MGRAAVAHLRAVDPVLARLIGDAGPPPVRLPTGDPYGALMRVICGQQLSVAAARAIYGRLVERFGGRPRRRRSCWPKIPMSCARPSACRGPRP